MLMAHAKLSSREVEGSWKDVSLHYHWPATR